MKLNKIPLFLIVCVLIITAAFGIWLLVDTGDGEEQVVLDIEKLYNVSIYGTQGEGFVDIQIDEEYLENICEAIGYTLTEEDVKPKLTRDNNLSNGDKFTVSLMYESNLTAKGVSISRDKVTYSVEGLKDGTDFDVFGDVIIYVEDGQLVIDNSRCSNFVKDNVDFFIKNQLETYKEGDTVIVGAYIDMNVATDNGYNIDKTEKEIVISAYKSDIDSENMSESE